MNIEIANRLVQLRKQNNLSQEALAEKLGISRQAVSKWERAEASPDTDNLILLARLYGVSLDELLRTEDEIPMPSREEREEADRKEIISVDDGAARGVEAWGGASGERMEYGSMENDFPADGFREGESRGDGLGDAGLWLGRFPMAIIISVVYVVIGAVWNAWHPGWLLFLLIPIWESLITAIKQRNAARFAYPVAMALLYLCLGFYGFYWHPGWVVFLTIPLYYAIVDYIRRLRNGGGTDEK